MKAFTYADALKELAEPRPVGDLIKEAIGRSARIVGISYTRAFDIWYGKARRIDDFEADQIAAALQKKREEEARNEIHDLRTRLLKMEARIAAEAANQSRPLGGATRGQSRGPRGLHRSVVRA